MAGRRTSTKKAAAADLDNALYAPRLDRLAVAEATDLGAGPGPSYEMILESICGVSDDSQPVEQYDGTLGVSTAFVDAHELPVAQVQWNDDLATLYTNPGDVNGVRWGSGTMIGPDLFLTCGHLFNQDPNGWTVPRQNGSSNAISPQDIAQNMHLNFEYQVDSTGTLRAEQRFAITQLIEYRLGGLDMALCRVAGNPGTTYGYTDVSHVDAAVGDTIAIIGHPAGQPKRIEAGPATTLSGSTIRYNDIDTLGGNSGSGILQESTGRVVGVHTNGGCNSQGTGSNSGVAIAAIRAVSPTLQALPPASQTAQANDNIATLLGADAPYTLFAADTQAGSDTNYALDNLATYLGADTPWLTTNAADILGTDLAGDVGTSFSGDDPNTWVENVFDPGNILVNPVIRTVLAGVAGLRPFVQAGPYRQQRAESASPTEPSTAELDAAIAAQAAVLAALQAARAAAAAAPA